MKKRIGKEVSMVEFINEFGELWPFITTDYECPFCGTLNFLELLEPAQLYRCRYCGMDVSKRNIYENK